MTSSRNPVPGRLGGFKGSVPRFTAKCRILSVTLDDGRSVLFKAYPLHVLASVLGRRPHTLRVLEYKGIIPPPLTQAVEGEQRFYLSTEIETYSRVFRECRAITGVSFEKVGLTRKLREALFDLQKQIASGEIPGDAT